ncbi:MAG: protein adenylyltransferase SelO [Caldimonas sp.]
MDTEALEAPLLSASAGPARWRNRLLDLGPRFFTRLAAQAMPDPHWVAASPGCAATLGFPSDWQTRPGWNALEVFSGNAVWPGMAPLASVYSGHQFGVWAGQLGDGRALWLGEIETPSEPMELQLKGAGQTPYSRMGDGRAVLRSSIREFLCSEAMHALGIPTTRALCVTGSDLPVVRETLESAAVVTRVAPSFIRFGHFEHFASRGDLDALRALADFVIDAYYPECRDAADAYASLLARVVERTAEMVAGWQAVGFCHGVMNTDNMSILGLTIDYGPFGFLDAFDPGHICNHSDHAGRYAWGRQPQVALWNLHALAHSLAPLIADEAAAPAALETFRSLFPAALTARFAAKLGLATREADDTTLIDDLLRLMAAARADFTITFRRLAGFDSANSAGIDAVRDLFLDRDAFDAWAARYGERVRRESTSAAERAARMNRVNPKYLLRNHLAEVAIRAATAGDFSEVERLRAVLQHPFDEQPESAPYAALPPDWAEHIEVSCSS